MSVAVAVAVAAIVVRCHVAPRAGQGLMPTGGYLPLALAFQSLHKRQPLPTLATKLPRRARLLLRWAMVCYAVLFARLGQGLGVAVRCYALLYSLLGSGKGHVFAVLCYAMRCYVTLCYAMLCSGKV